ncbi:MAG: carboxylesterase [Nocardioidaceae bacterium]|nr:carboxylesterase [Nocardioidaceae bacterium]
MHHVDTVPSTGVGASERRHVPLGPDVRAWLMQKAAPFTVSYGRGLARSGADLPRPRRITVPTRHGPVRCLVHRPAGEPVGTYVHFHGGAFLMRYPQMDDFFHRVVAAEVGATVVAVDYDVAPQVRYPVAQEEAYDVLAHVCASDDWPGPVAVGGFSAGGNLAASAALQARDAGTCRPVLQLLGVPAVDIAQEDKHAVVPDPMLGPDLLRLVRATYFPDAARRTEPYASPLRADSLAGVAPALVVTAERDLLRAEGDAYAAKLAADGVPVQHHVVPGADHYFMTSPAQAAPSLDLMTQALRDALGSSVPR